jgi:hypothetical protein
MRLRKTAAPTMPAERTTRECSSPGRDPSGKVNSAGGPIAIDLD